MCYPTPPLPSSSSLSSTSSSCFKAMATQTNESPRTGLYRKFFPAALSFFLLVVALIVPTDTGSTVIWDDSSSSSIVWKTSSTTSTPTPSPSSLSYNISASPTSTNAEQTEDSTATTIPSKERGTFVGEKLDARSLFKVYKDIEKEYYDKAFGVTARNKWKILANKEDVEVSMLEIPSDPTCPYVRMSVIVPTPLEECWDFLKLDHWDENIPHIDPFYEGVSLHGEFTYHGAHMILARKRTKRILAFGKRDFVFLSVSDRPLPDGTWVSGTVSVHTPKIPRQDGYTRAYQDSIAFYKPLDNNQKTQLTIVFRMDLNDSTNDGSGSGGWLPMWLYVKTIGTTGERSVISLRNVLVKAQEERRRKQHEVLLNEKEEHFPKRLSWTRLMKNAAPLENNNKHHHHDKDVSNVMETKFDGRRLLSYWSAAWRRGRRRGRQGQHG